MVEAEVGRPERGLGDVGLCEGLVACLFFLAAKPGRREDECAQWPWQSVVQDAVGQLEPFAHLGEVNR